MPCGSVPLPRAATRRRALSSSSRSTSRRFLPRIQAASTTRTRRSGSRPSTSGSHHYTAFPSLACLPLETCKNLSKQKSVRVFHHCTALPISHFHLSCLGQGHACNLDCGSRALLFLPPIPPSYPAPPLPHLSLFSPSFSMLSCSMHSLTQVPGGAALDPRVWRAGAGASGARGLFV